MKVDGMFAEESVAPCTAVQRFANVGRGRDREDRVTSRVCGTSTGLGLSKNHFVDFDRSRNQMKTLQNASEEATACLNIEFEYFEEIFLANWAALIRKKPCVDLGFVKVVRAGKPSNDVVDLEIVHADNAHLVADQLLVAHLEFAAFGLGDRFLGQSFHDFCIALSFFYASGALDEIEDDPHARNDENDGDGAKDNEGDGARRQFVRGSRAHCVVVEVSLGVLIVGNDEHKGVACFRETYH